MRRFTLTDITGKWGVVKICGMRNATDVMCVEYFLQQGVRQSDESETRRDETR